MSRTIDEKIVSMQFDNKQFESNVKTSLSTLNKLKQSLKLDGASKGLENVNAAAKGFDMSPMYDGIETVKAKFSALEVMAVTALANITNSVVNTGRRLASAITIEPIKNGLQEYESQINAVQTILANTQKEGTNVKIVNAALDDLNRYADKTIYNFTEMTRNIGTFTAAGVKLDTSVSAIKGIANIAAVSGSSSQQASTAMYQLSQAIASGTVKLMDWNSVVNAGMGGQVFQDALIRTSEHLKTGANAAIKAKGSFRESLQTGWLTTEVLTQTLDQFSTAADTQEEYEAAVKKFVEQGYSKEEAKQLADMAKTAGDAATKVKTFSQLIDTLKEALGSGWTESWRLIIGDFEEAKELWTQVSDYFSEAINKSSDARNELIKAWADGGGREMGIEAIKNAFEAVLRIIKPVKEAFREVFPRTTSDQLLKITKNIKDFTEKLKISNETADKLKRTFKGVFSVFDIFKKILGTVGKAIAQFLGSDGVSSLGGFLLDITAKIGDFLSSLNKAFDMNGISGVLSKIISGMSDLLKGVVDKFRGFGDIFSSVGNMITDVVGRVWGILKKFFGWLTESMSFKGIVGGIASIFGLLSGKKLYDTASGIQEFIKSIFDKSNFKASSIKDKISDLLNSVHDSLQSFTSGINVSSLLAISAAIGILAASMGSIAKLKADDVTKSLFAIASMFTMLNLTLKSMTKTLSKNRAKGIAKSAFALISMAAAINILANAMRKMASLSLGEIGKGLIGVGGGLAELCVALKFLDKKKISLRTSIAILALATSCSILGDALNKFGDIQWDEIGRGLTAMGGALVELVAAIGILGKIGGGGSILGSIGVLIAVQSLKKMADGLKGFGEMYWDEIGRGLTGMGGALGELGIVLIGLGKIAGFSSIFASASILIIIQGLNDLADAFKKFGEMSWDEIGRGLTAMFSALGTVAVGGLLNTFSGLGADAITKMSSSLGALADSVKKWTNVTVPEGIGDQLRSLAIGVNNFTFSGFGADALTAVAPGIGILADSVKKWTNVTVPEGIGDQLKGLATGINHFTFSGFGADALATAAPGIGVLADSVKKWTDVTVPEGIGDKLRSLAIGVNNFTFSGFGADALATAAPGIGVLADSVKKWTDVTIPNDLGNKLRELAHGVNGFALSALGGISLLAVSPGLGALADSIKKWSDVTIPNNIGNKLKEIAEGVKSFTLGFAGGWSLGSITGPLGDLAGSVKKWNGIDIPNGLPSQLQALSSSVKSFSWAFMGGWSLGSITGPLGDLAGSVKKWNGVSVPDGLGDRLSKLATGVKSFVGIEDISGVASSIKSISSAANTLSSVNFEAISTGFGSLAASAQNLNLVGPALAGASQQISSTVSSLMSTLITSITSSGPMVGMTLSSIISTALNSVATNTQKFYLAGYNAMQNFSNGIVTGGSYVTTIISTAINNISMFISNFQNSFEIAGFNLMTKFYTGMNSGMANAPTFISTAISQIVLYINNYQSMFYSAGTTLMMQFNTAIISGGAMISANIGIIINRIIALIITKGPLFYLAGSTFMERMKQGASAGGVGLVAEVSNIVNSIAVMIKNYYQSFYEAGEYLGEGLVAGIESKEQAAYDAGYALGQAAVQGEKDGQKSNSPSKLTIKAGKWLGEGLIIGMDRMSKSVNKAGNNMGGFAVDSISGALSRVSDCVDNSLNVRPTITPVVDMSNVNDIGLNLNSSIGFVLDRPVNALSQIVSDAQSSINTSNREVIEAINGLREDLNAIYESSDQEVALYVDSKKLATSLAKPMNRQLNILSKRGAY